MTYIVMVYIGVVYTVMAYMVMAYSKAPGTSTLKTRPSAGMLRVVSVPAPHA